MNGIGADEVIIETLRHDRSLHELEVNDVEDGNTPISNGEREA